MIRSSSIPVPTIRYVPMRHGAVMPTGIYLRGTVQTLCACLPEDVVLKSSRGAIIPTGVAVESEDPIPLQVTLLPALQRHHHILLLSVQRSRTERLPEIVLPLFNMGLRPYTIKDGDHIAHISFDATAIVDSAGLDAAGGTYG